MLSHSQVIAAFGGYRPLAEAIGISSIRASHWPRRGIPAKYWPRVAKAAAERSITVTVHDLMTLPAMVAA